MPSRKKEQMELAGMPAKPIRAKREEKQVTTAQRLGSLVKSARDLMRKDKGLSGDADRLPQLTWIMFLKFLDDLEQTRGGGSAIRGGVPPYSGNSLPLARLGGS